MVIQLGLFGECWENDEPKKKKRKLYTKKAVAQYEARQLRLIFLPRLYSPDEAWMLLGAKNRQELYYWIRQHNGVKVCAIKVGREWKIIPTWDQSSLQSAGF